MKILNETYYSTEDLQEIHNRVVSDLGWQTNDSRSFLRTLRVIYYNDPMPFNADGEDSYAGHWSKAADGWDAVLEAGQVPAVSYKEAPYAYGRAKPFDAIISIVRKDKLWGSDLAALGAVAEMKGAEVPQPVLEQLVYAFMLAENSQREAGTRFRHFIKEGGMKGLKLRIGTVDPVSRLESVTARRRFQILRRGSIVSWRRVEAAELRKKLDRLEGMIQRAEELNRRSELELTKELARLEELQEGGQ